MTTKPPVACIGAGNVGRAWAVVFARGGHEVRLFDADPKAVAERAIPAARALLHDLAAEGLLNEDPDLIAARIHAATSIAGAVAGVAHVQESVREDVEVKRVVFAEIAAAAPRDAVLASSTSAIPGSRFMLDVEAPERCLVAHPVNPPALIPLVELCGTGKTSEETFVRTDSFMRGLGMRPVRLRKEIEGFLLNRLQFTLVGEAMHLVNEGYCSVEDMDAVLTHGLALRWAFIGPFAAMHLNASEGFGGFTGQLGGMMKAIGADAKPDYPWTPEQAAAIHADLASRVPVAAVPARQAWRDRRIMRLRKHLEDAARSDED
jgi:L-gulonate 3-dehydrogenase